MDHERGIFPPTRQSAVAGVASGDPAARARGFDLIVRAYWKPVYAHVRLKWRRGPEDARDVTQSFFVRAIEKGGFGSYDPGRARFRTFLKALLDNHVRELARSDGRQKRGGGTLQVSLDFDDAESELARHAALDGTTDGGAVDACFDRELVRVLFTSALAELEGKCARTGKAVYFEIFRAYVLDPEENGTPRPSYADLAAKHGVRATDVTNYLAWTRRELRGAVLEALRELTSSEEELRDEARALLGSGS